MAWIKRNLFFVIGGVVAVLLLGLAGFYDFKNWERNSKALAALNEAYQTLRQLGSQTPSPGNDEVNNIAAARQQTQEVRAWIARASQYFQPVPPIPRPANGALTSKDFADALSRTVARMQDEAAAASVALPAQFSFSFTVQQQGLRFAPGSLLPLAQQLGDVKAIC
ncbi:MAG: Amuc_1100 family pilus-like protein, partial [Verrucomicrobia bacterium]|nr:Amuc_1100 family pilus-like protein [Verrucomicrobiota bacterium]